MNYYLWDMDDFIQLGDVESLVLEVQSSCLVVGIEYEFTKDSCCTQGISGIDVAVESVTQIRLPPQPWECEDCSSCQTKVWYTLMYYVRVVYLWR